MKTARIIIIGVMTVFVMSTAGYIQAGNLLRNGGFEDVYSVAEGVYKPYDWPGDASDSAVKEAGGGFIQPVRSGNYSLQMSGINPLQGQISQVSFEEDFGLDYDGQVFKASIYSCTALIDSIIGTQFTAILSIGFQLEDGSAVGHFTTLLDGQDPDLENNQWIYSEIVATAPMNTKAIYFGITIDSPDEEYDYPGYFLTEPKQMYFDDASLVIVPEPTSAALFALTAAAVMRRRVA